MQCQEYNPYSSEVCFAPVCWISEATQLFRWLPGVFLVVAYPIEIPGKPGDKGLRGCSPCGTVSVLQKDVPRHWAPEAAGVLL